jgi:hypothetical protein
MASQAETEFQQVYELLMPALARAAIGDFGADIEVERENSVRVNEILMGVSVLFEVIREQRRELAEAEAKLKKRSKLPELPLLEEVLEPPHKRTHAS